MCGGLLPPATGATLNVDDDTVYEPHSDGETSQSPDPSHNEEGPSDKLSQDPHNGEGLDERLVKEDNINVFKRRNLDDHSDSEVEEITIQQVRAEPHTNSQFIYQMLVSSVSKVTAIYVDLTHRKMTTS